MFYKMIKENETSYVILLIIQAIGIGLNFIEIISKVQLHFLGVIIKYILYDYLAFNMAIIKKQVKKSFKNAENERRFLWQKTLLKSKKQKLLYINYKKYR